MESWKINLIEMWKIDKGNNTGIRELIQEPVTINQLLGNKEWAWGGSNEMDRQFKKVVKIQCETAYKERKRRQSHR